MKIILFLASLLATCSIHAQNGLRGRVLDNANGAPLEQASVYFPQLENGVVTDAEGQFELRNLPDGTYKLVVSMIGYGTYTTNIQTSSAGEYLEIRLEPSAIEMEEVIVSTPFHKLQRENVMKVEQAPVKELKRNGAITLADGIRQLPGVETLSTGVGIGKPVIRGLSSNRVLVYTQGIRLENQQFGDEHGLGIGDAGVESVEVIKGPASLLYGSDALGGVLYLNPERYADPRSYKANVRSQYFSATLGMLTQAGAGVSGDSWKFLARLARASHADYKDGSGTRVTNTRFGEWDFKTGVAYSAGSFRNDTRYNYTYSKPGIAEEIGEQTRDRAPLLPYQEITSHIVSNTSEWFLSQSSLKLILGYVGNQRLEFEDHHEEEGEPEAAGEEEGPALDMRLNTINYNLQYQFSVHDNKFLTILGLQGMWQQNTNFGEEVLIPDARTADVGLMATSHLHFKSSDLQLGLRYDHRNLEGQAYGTAGSPDYIQALQRNFNSFNAALGYRLDIGTKMIGRVNLASGFRAPNLSELLSNGTHSGANRYEIGNPDLANERNVQADLALEYKGEHLELSVNGFRNRVADYIYLAPTGAVSGADPVYQYRQGDALLYGGETGLHWHPHPLDWLHLQSNLALVLGRLDTGQDLPLIPPLSWKNTLRVEFDKVARSWQNVYGFLGLECYFRQSRVSEFETETPGYNLVNAGLGGETRLFGKTLEVQLSANNLFDTAYISHLSRLKPDGIYNIGRNLSLGVNLLL